MSDVVKALLIVLCFCFSISADEPPLSTEVAELEKSFDDYDSLFWTATVLNLVKVEEYNWRHTFDDWGIAAGEVGLAIWFEVPSESLDVWDMKEGWPLTSVQLAGEYVKHWSLVIMYSKRDYLRAIGEQSIPYDTAAPNERREQTQQLANIQMWPKLERDLLCAPGLCRAEWIFPPDDSRQLVVLAHWDSCGPSPAEMAAKIIEGKILKGWIFNRTRKRPQDRAEVR